jgi:hypothetical protein
MNSRKLFSSRLLTEESPRAPDPPSFRGQLFPSQAAVLHRMLLMEREQRMPIIPGKAAPGKGGSVLAFNGGSLTTPFASGKTVVISALVATEVPPRRVPPILNLPEVERSGIDISTVADLPATTSSRRRTARPGFGLSDTPFATFEWIPDRVIPSTLVVAANSVLSHWEETLGRFVPHLSCFTIDSVDRLREYVTLVQSGAHANYHIVLLKMGVMAFQTADCKKNSSLTALCYSLPGLIWDRLVIDDYDTITIPKSARLPPAFFTWYVSATRRSTLSSVSLGMAEPALTPEYLGRYLDPILPGGWPAIVSVRDALLASNLCVNCSEKFQNSNFVLPAPVIMDHRFNRPNSFKLLQGLDISPEVQEALNAGAVHTAAELLGFSCRTPAELASRVLNKHKIAFTLAVDEQHAITSVEAYLKSRMSRKEILVKHVTLILTCIREGWRPTLTQPIPSTIPDDVGFGPRFSELAEPFWEKRELLRDNSGRALERLRENAREGECQVCLLPWADAPVDSDGPASKTYIMNCCQTLLCTICVTAAGADGKQFVRECPNCFQKLFHDGKCHILAMSSDIKLEDVEFVPESEVAEETPTTPKPTDAASRIEEAWKQFGRDEKIRALLQLVEGYPISAGTVEPGKPIAGLLGNDGPIIDRPDAATRRFLLFSQHPESTARILEVLGLCEIPCAVLNGRRSEKDRLIHRFRSSMAPREVLIITASKDCAGIHLPECTDQVYFHRMLSGEVNAQLAGRAQRHGRRASLRIHNLLYSDE